MVYITGDMHGDESRLYDKEWRKLKKDDVLIVCGDFGFVLSKKEEKELEHRQYDLIKKFEDYLKKHKKA